jgi:hypothetical protein
MINVKMKIKEINDQVEMLILKGRRGRGRRIVISTSKIKKIMAIIKKRREKGIRDREKGANPHSKGEVFSRSIKAFFLKSVAVRMIARAIAMIKKMIRDSVIISFPGIQISSLEVKYIVVLLEKNDPHQ